MARKRSSDFLEACEDVVGRGMPGGEIFLVGRRKSGGEIFLKKWEWNEKNRRAHG